MKKLTTGFLLGSETASTVSKLAGCIISWLNGTLPHPRKTDSAQATTWNGALGAICPKKTLWQWKISLIPSDSLCGPATTTLESPLPTMSIGPVEAVILESWTWPDCQKTDTISIDLCGITKSTPCTYCLTGHGREEKVKSRPSSSTPIIQKPNSSSTESLRVG